MSIQDVFYLLGSIFMGFGIILLIIIGIVLWTIKNKITDLHILIDEKVNKLTSFADHPGSVAVDLGSKAAAGAISTVTGFIKNKTSKYTTKSHQ